MNCSKCNVGEIQKTEFISDYETPNKITTVYGCNRCSYAWSEQASTIFQTKTIDAIFRKEDGWHTMQTGPRLKFDHSKQEMIADVIADLIDSGLDEDAHFRNKFITSDRVKPSDFLNFVTDVDKLDVLMNMIRDHVILTLRKVANDLEKEELK